ncbi:MAG: TonB-dependent receptor, partial [Candidatus Eremiobacteraeota bacterium]|nr:TonB-dependent receptor [Candidatus Eremiobacteraeota bacterium]
DAQTGKPVADARTILVGPETASSLTTAAGVIHYTDVPVGIYRVRVIKRGYQAGVSSEFDVLSDRSINVRVALALSTGGLKVIGSVTARASVSVSSNDISDSSPIRRLSDSLTDALDKIAGVSVTQDATDPNSPVTISLNGHDESQTAVSLDGIPLSAPGSAAICARSARTSSRVRASARRRARGRWEAASISGRCSPRNRCSSARAPRPARSIVPTTRSPRPAVWTVSASRCSTRAAMPTVR